MKPYLYATFSCMHHSKGLFLFQFFFFCIIPPKRTPYRPRRRGDIGGGEGYPLSCNPPQAGICTLAHLYNSKVTNRYYCYVLIQRLATSLTTHANWKYSILSHGQEHVGILNIFISKIIIFQLKLKFQIFS